MVYYIQWISAHQILINILTCFDLPTVLFYLILVMHKKIILWCHTDFPMCVSQQHVHPNAYSISYHKCIVVLQEQEQEQPTDNNNNNNLCIYLYGNYSNNVTNTMSHMLPQHMQTNSNDSKVLSHKLLCKILSQELPSRNAHSQNQRKYTMIEVTFLPFTPNGMEINTQHVLDFFFLLSKSV